VEAYLPVFVGVIVYFVVQPATTGLPIITFGFDVIILGCICTLRYPSFTIAGLAIAGRRPRLGDTCS
jgi:hypothetical protein